MSTRVLVSTPVWVDKTVSFILLNWEIKITYENKICLPIGIEKHLFYPSGKSLLQPNRAVTNLITGTILANRPLNACLSNKHLTGQVHAHGRKRKHRYFYFLMDFCNPLLNPLKIAFVVIRGIKKIYFKIEYVDR